MTESDTLYTVVQLLQYTDSITKLLVVYIHLAVFRVHFMEGITVGISDLGVTLPSEAVHWPHSITRIAEY